MWIKAGFVLTIGISSALELRNHNYRYREDDDQDSGDFLLGLFWFAAVCGIIAICYFGCRRWMNRNTHQNSAFQRQRNRAGVVNHPQPQPHIVNPPPVAYQQPYHPPPNYPVMNAPQPVNQPNPLALVHQSFNQYQQQPLPPNPYSVDVKASRNSWDQRLENVSPQGQARLQQPCSICRARINNGEDPNAMLGCSQNHCFHLSCLGDHRRCQKQAGRNPNECPTCYERCPSTIRLFCNACRSRSTEVNLDSHMNTDGSINLDILRGHYGQLCKDCQRF